MGPQPSQLVLSIAECKKPVPFCYTCEEGLGYSKGKTKELSRARCATIWQAVAVMSCRGCQERTQNIATGAFLFPTYAPICDYLPSLSSTALLGLH